ncbi:hypothetical protein [Sporosarcina sp. ITBMC105]
MNCWWTERESIGDGKRFGGKLLRSGLVATGELVMKSLEWVITGESVVTP